MVASVQVFFQRTGEIHATNVVENIMLTPVKAEVV